MPDDADLTPRRRRRRATAPAGTPAKAASAAPTPATAEPAKPQPARRERGNPKGRRESNTERMLRDIVGGGRSQVGVSGALRARDVNRPTAEDLAEAEREVEIVRRHWRPS